jgi:transposase
MWRGCLVRGERLEMWVMDEHRIGLKPLLRRIWAPRGQRPIVRVQPRYQWLYLYAFAHPNTGRSFYLLMPTVSIVVFSVALAEFATFVGASAKQQILILLDKAGWHTSPEVERPAGVGLRFLPAYSPELQPAEHLWQLTDVPLVNRWFASLDDLESALAQRLSWLQDQFDLVRSTTQFHWWPALV